MKKRKYRTALRLLLVISVFLNACTGASPKHSKINANAQSDTTNQQNRDPILADVITPPWQPYPREQFSQQWAAFEDSVRSSLGRHDSTDELKISLLGNAQIPNEAASAVVVNLANGGPHLTEIFAANGDALSNTGYEILNEPLLALPQNSGIRGAMLGYRIPSTKTGSLNREMVALQYLVATDAVDNYLFYSLTIDADLFDSEAWEFRRWVIDLHGHSENLSLNAGQNGVMPHPKKLPPSLNLEDTFPIAISSETSSFTPTNNPSQAGSYFGSPGLLDSTFRTARIASLQPTSPTNRCITAYEEGVHRARRPFVEFINQVFDGDSVTAATAMTNLYDPEIATLWYVPEDQAAVTAALAKHIEDSELQGRPWESLPAHVAISQRAHDWTFPNTQIDISRRGNPDDITSKGLQIPSPNTAANPQGTWLGGVQECLQSLKGWDKCHDDVVENISTAVTAAQLLVPPLFGYAEVVGTTVDHLDMHYKGFRMIDTCFAEHSRLQRNELRNDACSQDSYDQFMAVVYAVLPGAVPKRGFIPKVIDTGAKLGIDPKALKAADAWHREAVDALHLEAIDTQIREVLDTKLQRTPALDIIKRRYSRLQGHIISHQDTFTGKEVQRNWKQGGDALKKTLFSSTTEGEGTEPGSQKSEKVWSALTSSYDKGVSTEDLFSGRYVTSEFSELHAFASGWVSSPFSTRGTMHTGTNLSTVAQVDETVPNSNDFVFLALWVLSSESDGGIKFTAAERRLLETTLVEHAISQVAIGNLISNIESIATGDGHLAIVATLDTIFAEIHETTRTRLAVLDTISSELSNLSAWTDAQRLPEIPARRQVARPLNYLLVDQRSGIEIRGATAQDGLEDLLWLGPQRMFTLIYSDGLGSLASTTFKTGNESGPRMVAPVLARDDVSGDYDDDGISDADELVIGSDPTTHSNTDKYDNSTRDFGLIGRAQTSDYAIDVCPLAPDLLAVADVEGGLTLFHVETGKAPKGLHQEPAETFGGALVSLFCDSLNQGRMLVETLDGKLLAVNLSRDVSDYGLSTPHLVLDFPLSWADTEPNDSYWRSVAFTPNWIFLGDNLGSLHGRSVNYLSSDFPRWSVPKWLPTTVLDLDHPTSLFAGPGSEHPVVSEVPSNVTLDIGGRNPEGNWLQVARSTEDDEVSWIATSQTSITRQELAALPVFAGEPIENLAFYLDTLYVLTPDSLQAYLVGDSTDQPTLHFLGRVSVPGVPSLHEWKRVLAVSDRSAFVGGMKGLIEVDITDPMTMKVSKQADFSQGMIQDLHPISDDTLLSLTQFVAGGARFLALMDLSPETMRAEIVAMLPSTGNYERLSVVDGLAYVAAGPEGLVAVNMVGVQTGHPKMRPVLRTNMSPGLRESDRPLVLQVSTEDPTILRRVVLLRDNELYLTDVTPPFSFVLPPEDVIGVGNQRSYELTLTDTLGRTVQVPVSWQTVSDAKPPKLLEIVPRHKLLDFVMVTSRVMSLYFSEPIELDQLTDPGVQLLHLQKQDDGYTKYISIPVELELDVTGEVLQVTLPQSLAPGDYILVVNPNLRDVNGNFIDRGSVQNYTLTKTSTPVSTSFTDRFSFPETIGLGQLTWHLARPTVRNGSTVRKGHETNRASAVHVGLPLDSPQRLSGTQVASLTPLVSEEALWTAVEANDVMQVLQLLSQGVNPDVKKEDNSLALIHLYSTSKAASEGPMESEDQRGPSWRTPLFDAPSADVAAALLLYGADPVIRNPYGVTPLHNAASSGRTEVVALLLLHGADSNLQDGLGWSPLHNAVYIDSVEVVKILLGSGADPDVGKNIGWTPLHLAAQQGNHKVMEVLLDCIGDPNSLTELHWTPLFMASGWDHTSEASLLLDSGADPNHPDVYGWRPLHVSAESGHASVTELLIDRGANVHSQTYEGRMPLVVALQENHVEVVEILLINGADPNIRLDNTWMPLHWAAQEGNAEMTGILLSYGADPNTISDYGITPIQIALEKGHQDIARLLLTHGVDLNVRYGDDWTLLHLAVYRNQLDTTELLLNLGIEPDAYTATGWTSLQLAVQEGHVEIAHLLLLHGADPNVVKLEGGWTVLHWAVQQNSLELVELLLAAGADPNVRRDDGWTSLHHSSHQGKVGMVKKLLEYGADPSSVIQRGITSLHLASEENHVEVVQELLKAGANPNVSTVEGWTPLHLAASKGNLLLAQTLLTHGADPTANYGEVITPMDMAAVQGHSEMLALFQEHLTKTTSVSKDGQYAVPDDLDRAIDPKSLLKAAFDNDKSLVLYLLERGLDPNVRGDEGLTPLLVAVYFGYSTVVEVLLTHGADPHLHADNGQSSVHIAAGQGHWEVLEMMIDHGANANLQATTSVQSDVMPLHLAIEGQHLAAAEVLLKHGADVQASTDGVFPIHRAVFVSDLAMVQLLLTYAANPNSIGPDGARPLHLAAQEGNKDVVNVLLNNGADISVRDDHGFTPLLFALRSGHIAIMKTLLQNGANPNVLFDSGEIQDVAPLHMASMSGNVAAAEVLIEFHADLNVRAVGGYTPLHVAAMLGDVEMIKVLLIKGANKHAQTDGGHTAAELGESAGHVAVVELLQE